MPDLPWPLPDRVDLRDSLLSTYAARRGYHDLQHLREVLERIDALGGADEADLVLAAWFHDAVYDGDRDDEERSAVLAETSLSGTDADVATVVRLVRLTATHSPQPGDRLGEILCDADLGILAAPPERYRAYAEGVRADYAHIDDASFVEGRIAVLQDLLARESLFHTDDARAHWDAPARANLTAEIESLTAALVS
ncbi:MAG TPA: hypothetical protein VF426_02465 [Marmoricola sp.]